MTWLAFFVAIFLAAGVTPAMGRDPSGQNLRLTIKMRGRSFDLEARVFRPSGQGPFPVVTINHGIPASMNHSRSARMVFTRADRWLVAQGYMVVEALRPGFGNSEGPFQERSGPCDQRNYLREGRDTAALEAAIAQSSAKLSGADARRILIVGHSAGGFGAIALADAPPPGVVGVISFAGGRGSDGLGHICGGRQRLLAATSVFGKDNKLPQLWLAAANDPVFPLPLEHEMAAAYEAGSKPSVRLVELPAVEGGGHMALVEADPTIWAAAVSAFLKTVVGRAHGV